MKQPSAPMAHSFRGGGEMAARISTFDWDATTLGPIATWPQSLKTAVQIMLTSRQPIWLGWGPQLTKLYNDPYRMIVGGKHPAALGQPAAVVWSEIWEQIGPLLVIAMGGDEGTYVEAQLLIMERHGYQEETYYTFSYSPILNDDGSVGGIICANTDDTQRVIGERQLALLRELASRTAHAHTVHDACVQSANALATNQRDLPLALIYLLDDGGLRLAGAHSQNTLSDQIAPPTLELDSGAIWQCADVIASGTLHVVDVAPPIARHLPCGSWE
ncbi:MAG TPA: hypothetical protein VFT99_16115, partial [Roseiflexaceae bacterium]|nr:hypothetical protein [Roseiflexaceae bacterium]